MNLALSSLKYGLSATPSTLSMDVLRMVMSLCQMQIFDSDCPLKFNEVWLECTKKVMRSSSMLITEFTTINFIITLIDCRASLEPSICVTCVKFGCIA